MKNSQMAVPLINFVLLSMAIAAPAQNYVEHIFLSENHLLDDDGNYVQISSIVDEQEPIPQHAKGLAKIDAPVHLRQDEVDEETPIDGPGYTGILAGLTGIFSNVVNGNLGKVVESTFNFVPPAHQGDVQGVYNSLLGKPPITTPSVDEDEPTESAAAVGIAPATASKKPTRVTVLAPAAGSGDDEEEAGRKLVLKLQ